MTATREALTLPLLFLSVVLLGGFRLTVPVQVMPPTVFSLVLATLLMAAFVQSGTLAPERLLRPERSTLANVNGGIVLVAAFAATAQILSLVVPDSGLPALVFGVFLFVVILLVLSASLDRVRLLRALAVMLGSAFVLKFVVLAALSSPAGGRVARALQLLFEGVTLGMVAQVEVSPGAGYVAFLALGLYLAAISLLPSAGWVNVRRIAPPLDHPGSVLSAERSTAGQITRSP